jgi:hypothetical protein
VNYQKAPFPWFGGKSQCADLVWSLPGDCPHYIEPFFGSGAVLLNRPHPCNRPYFSETVNDLDGFVVNAWRAIQYYPEETAAHASWPVTELDKNARQIAVLKWRTEKTWELLAGTHDYCDPRMAGWWLWGTCVQIGAFDGRGPWTADPVTGRIRKWEDIQSDAEEKLGVFRDRPDISTDGKGVNHAGARELGVRRDRPDISTNGRGVNRPQLREPEVLSKDPTNEFHPMAMPELVRWFQWLSARMRHVRVVNGSWDRVCTTGAAWTLPVRQGAGPCGVFFDPPYSVEAGRDNSLYAEESTTVAHDVREWCLKHGDNKKFRIVLAGYDVEHVDLERHGWTAHEWFSKGFLRGGMGNIAKRVTADDNEDPLNQQHRERVWASPNCLRSQELLLF